MGTLTYQEVLQAATQLTPDERGRLLVDLKSTLEEEIDWELRAKLMAEFERRKAMGAFEKAESLYGKYAKPGTSHIDEAEFHDYFREIGSEWQDELDEFYTPDA